MSLFIEIFILVFILAVLKYALIHGFSYLYFWKLNPNWIQPYKIQVPERTAPKPMLELKYSAITLVIMSLVLTFITYFSEFGLQVGAPQYFKVFLNFGSHGVGLEIFSIIFYVFFYDAYFYWTHRWMHSGWLYKKIHSVHHRSINPTPFATYSFHPLEAFINIFYLVPFLYFFPVSLSTLWALLIFSDLSNWNGHVGYDFLPKWSINFLKTWGGITTPTHHNMHHQFAKSNFGLYWSGWDRFFKTLHPNTESEFLKIKARSKHS